jgi:mannose-1-phosphate guanylyltransferase
MVGMRHAVILAGGSGTRLWPASRRARPKQFLDLSADGESLLAAAVRRAKSAVDGSVVVVTAAEHEDLVRQHARDVEILAEPVGKNTAAALGLAAVHLLAEDPDAVIGALPADQHIGDDAAMADVLARAFQVAETSERICTIGLVPTRPETGFGYLELGGHAELGVAGVREVARFVEKPPRAEAEAYVAGGRHLWNGGMFFLKARRLADDLARYLPAVWAGLERIAAALAADATDRELASITAEAYAAIPSVSIDHGVMEKASGVVTVPAEVGWSDVGSWAAFADLREGDGVGNVTRGDVVVCDGARNVVIGDPGRVVAVVGVSDLVIVQSGDAVLVVPKERAQDVRVAVEALGRAGLERFL